MRRLQPAAKKITIIMCVSLIFVKFSVEKISKKYFQPIYYYYLKLI